MKTRFNDGDAKNEADSKVDIPDNLMFKCPRCQNVCFQEEFEKTRAYLEKINLYEMHIFKYSVREGTRAQKMSGHVPEQVKTERSEVLLSMAKRHKTAFEEWYVGRKEKVLLEEIVEKNGKKYFQGYTAHYVKVAVELTENDTKLEQNEVIVVDIQGLIDENLLYGKVSIEF